MTARLDFRNRTEDDAYQPLRLDKERDFFTNYPNILDRQMVTSDVTNFPPSNAGT